TCSLKSVNFASVTRLPPDFLLRRIPLSASHSLVPSACQPVKSRPLKSGSGVFHCGGDARRSAGARTPVNGIGAVLPIVIEPVRRSFSRRAVTATLPSARSHCGGIVKRASLPAPCTSDTGRALPESPTNDPTSVLFPECRTSSHPLPVEPLGR